MKSLGIDVGNGKTKLCLIESDGAIASAMIRWDSVPLPFTRDRRSDFAGGVPANTHRFLATHDLTPPDLDVLVVCCSHGYSFETFSASAEHLAGVLEELTTDGPPAFLVSVTGALHAPADVRSMAADARRALAITNFVGSAWLGARCIRGEGLSVDVGTTSTEVMPIVGGAWDPEGLQDPARYARFRFAEGRLGWLGLTATPVSLLAGSVPVGGGVLPLTGRPCYTDAVFSLLGQGDRELLTRHAYGWTFPSEGQAAGELAQAVGLDTDLVSADERLAMARFFHERLIGRVAEQITRVADACFGGDRAHLELALFGLGAELVAAPAAARAGLDPERAHRLHLHADRGLYTFSSAFGMALRGLEHARGGPITLPPDVLGPGATF
jgi:uncharacterized hydantoinase/oxoprolinase family protein